MRNSTLLLALIQIALCSVLRGQVRTYDYKTLPAEVKETVYYKVPVTVVIRNINKKVYKVASEKATTNFNIALPDGLKGLKAPSFLFLAPLPVSGAPAAPSVDSVSPVDAIKNAFAMLNQKSLRLRDAIWYGNDIGHVAQSCDDSGTAIIDKVQQLTQTYLYGSGSLPGGRTKSDLGLLLSDTLEKLYPDVPGILENLDRNVKQYTHDMQQAIDDQQATTQSNIDELEKDLPSKKGADHTRQLELIKEQKDLMSALTKGKKQFDAFSSELQEKLKEAHEAGEAILSFKKEDKFYVLENLYKVLTSASTYSYTADPFIPKKDEVKLTLTVSPNEVNGCNIPDVKTTVFTFKVTGGLKMDFSTGIFFNSGSESFLGKSYYWQNLSDTTRKLMTAQRSHRLMLSVGGLLHFYQRSPAFVKLGGSFGASTTAGFDEFNFHAGPSLILGNKNRVVLTAGVTFKSSKVLDQQLTEGGTYQTKYSPDAIPTVAVFPKLGGFLAISYNLNLD